FNHSSFNQGQLHRPQVNQPPTYQAPVYQAPIPQTQRVFQLDFESYVKANDAILRNIQSQGQKELKAYEAQTVKSSVDEPPEVELKALPHHLEYAFLEGNDKLPVIIAKELRTILNSEPLPPLPNHEQYLHSYKKELKVCKAKTIKSSVDEPSEVELKDLPPHLEYIFLEGDNKLPVIIAKELRSEEKSVLIKVLKFHKQAIAWKLSDIQGINPEFYTHRILMEEDYKPAGNIKDGLIPRSTTS
nr:reverse transcriptase domain-containing protein [Tanacetum cinerariifolium]